MQPCNSTTCLSTWWQKPLILVILPISPTPKIGGGIVTAVIIISLPSFLPSFLTDRPTDPSTIFSSLPIPIGTKIFFFHVRERASCGGGRLALSALRRRGAAVSTFTCWFILGTAATAAADDAGGMAAASAMPRPSIDSGRLVELKVDIQL